MSEEHATPAEQATEAAPAAVEQLAVEAPAVDAPVVEQSEQTQAEPASPEPKTPAEPTLKPHTDEPGLLRLSEEAPKQEEKTEDGEKPPDTQQVEQEVTKYEFTVPEGIELQADRVETFQNFAREQKFTQETAQSLMDMHASAMQAYSAHLLQGQHDFWAKTRSDWRTEVAADPVLGGAGLQTNQRNAIDGIFHTLVPEAMRIAERQGHPMPEFAKTLDETLLMTGMCDHPAFMWLGLAANALAAKLREPAQEQVAVAQTPRQPIPGAGGSPNGGGRLSYKYSRGSRGER